MPQPNYVSRGGKLFKEVVCKSNGYLMPGEMVAVLGPSGCGKTSLLNNLSQRTSLSGGSFNSGLIKINGKALSPGDFGKIGAFVQQDDVLVSTNTVKESFEFACRLTNRHLSQPQMDKKVDTMIKCLGLQACKDTLIGGFMIKSISGGERKRTSIGYELITDPSILLLDEPTSGLDSSTSLRIIRILREQAKERGMAIMATIHQPSSDVLFCFDRVIIMSDGYQIYSGPPDQMTEFFSPFGYKKPRFCNPADQLSTIASMPSKLLYPQTTILQLAAHVNEVQTQYTVLKEQDAQRLYQQVSQDLWKIGERRRSPFCRQYTLLLGRLVLFLRRNPISISFIIFIAFMNCFLWASIYWQVCSEKFSIIHEATDETIVLNLLGMCFLLIQDQFVETSFGQVLQIPQSYPVFKREVGGNLYSATAYYLAVQTMSVLTFLPYAFLCTLLFIFTLKIPDLTVWIVLRWWSVLQLVGMTGNCFGLMWGSFLTNEMTAINVVQFFMILFSMGAGMFSNTGQGSNFLIKFLSWISPLHYGMALLFDLELTGKRHIFHKELLQYFGFDYSYYVSYGYLVFFVLICFMIGWIGILRLAKA